MLFTFPVAGPNAGKFVASLIDPAAGGKARGAVRPSRRGPRDHRATIQIVRGAANDVLIPKVLNSGVNVDIAITGGPPLGRTESFNGHVPNLEAIIEKGTSAVKQAGKGQPNRRLIRNEVTVDRGLVRVKDVMAWDEGGFPLGGGGANGNRASSPVLVNFVGSELEGHMASEVIVEADDDTVEVQLRSSDKDDKDLNGPREGEPHPSHRHVPPNAVEILVTNYEPPSNKPTPWGLDFQWLFETAGYNVADLSIGGRFNDWVAMGTQYDPTLFRAERTAMLDGPENTIGQPFPFVSSTASIMPLRPLASPRNPPVCPFATTTPI
jgi:hypothetical protein